MRLFWVTAVTLLFTTYSNLLNGKEDLWRVVDHSKGFALVKGSERFSIEFDVGTPRYLKTVRLNENFLKNKKG